MRRGLLVLAPLLLLIAGPPVGAGEADLPVYRIPEALADSPPPSAVVGRQIAVLLEEPGNESEGAWRVLAGLGTEAVAPVVRALPSARWFGRTLLMTALAESGDARVLPVLVEGSNDPAWAVREAAAVGLSRIPQPEAVQALLRLVSDESWRVRRTATIALRHQVSRDALGREAAIPRLLTRARDPDRDVRFVALRELGHLEAAEATDLLLEGFLGGEEREREVCLDALTRMPHARDDLLRALEQAMQTADDREFLKAAQKYAQLTDGRLLANPPLRDRLLRLLRDSSGSLVPVTKVFEGIGAPAVPVLLENLRDFYRSPGRIPREDPSQPVLDLVQTILGADAAPVLRDILLTWEEALPTRRYAVVLARRSHAGELTDTLKELYLRESFADLRSALLEAIAASAPEDLATWIGKAARDGNFQVRRTAQMLLRRHPGIDLTATIQEALAAETNHPGLANDWLGLLAKRDRGAVFRGAAALLARPDPEFRARGAAWLRLGADTGEVLAKLTKAYETEDGRHRDKDYDLPEERLAAVRAGVISMILQSARYAGGPDAVPLLQRAAADEDAVVREKALAELARIDAPRVPEIALEALKTEDQPGPLREARRIVVAADSEPARQVVLDALSGEDILAREGFLRALRSAEEAPLPGIVIEALRKGIWEAEARVLAIQAVRSRRDPGHRELFVRLLRESSVTEVRTECVQALGEAGDPRAVEPLLALLPPPGRDLRDLDPENQRLAAFAIVALGELGSPDAVPHLLDLLAVEWPLALIDRTEDRRHFETTSHVLTALGHIGDRRALAPLLGRIFTPDLSRWFTLLTERRGDRGRNLLGTLVSALVRFDDDLLRAALGETIGPLTDSGEIYRMDEGFLLYLARLFEDPRIERLAENRPRRGLATDLRRIVLDVVPRESDGDLAALESLSSRAANRGRYEEAADLRERANRLARVLDPVDYEETREFRLARLDFLLGLALLAAGDDAGGRAALDRGLARDPEDEDVLNLYAWWLAVTGRDLEVALEAALEAGRRSSSEPYVLDTIGWVLHRMGRHEEGAWQLREAVRLDREEAERSEEGRRVPDPSLSYHLAAAASMAGRLEAAADWIGIAVSMDDTLADRARSDPDFAPLRDAGGLEPALSVPE